MQKLITLENGQEILLDGNITWTMIYQNQFGRDIIPDLMPALSTIVELAASVAEGGADIDDFRAVIASLGDGNAANAIAELTTFKTTDLLNIIWSLAKCANEDIAPPYQWLRQFDVFPLDKIIPEAFGLVMDSSISLKNLTSLREDIAETQAKIAEKTRRKKA